MRELAGLGRQAAWHPHRSAEDTSSSTVPDEKVFRRCLRSSCWFERDTLLPLKAVWAGDTELRLDFFDDLSRSYIRTFKRLVRTE